MRLIGSWSSNKFPQILDIYHVVKKRARMCAAYAAGGKDMPAVCTSEAEMREFTFKTLTDGKEVCLRHSASWQLGASNCNATAHNITFQHNGPATYMHGVTT